MTNTKAAETKIKQLNKIHKLYLKFVYKGQIMTVLSVLLYLAKL